MQASQGTTPYTPPKASTLGGDEALSTVKDTLTEFF